MHADAELRLLAAHRQGADSADALAEAAELEERLPAEGHVRPDEVPDRLGVVRHAGVGAPDDPVELGREPSGPALGPHGLDGAAGRDEVRIACSGRRG